MDDALLLPVSFQGEDLEFETLFYQYGYSHRVQVTIKNIKVIFEPDEERNYRALINQEEFEKSDLLSVTLLQAIAEKLETLSK